MESDASKSYVDTIRRGDLLVLKIGGNWRLSGQLPDFETMPDPLQENPDLAGIAFNTKSLNDWDSGLLSYLFKCLQFCRENELTFVQSSLPADIQSLLDLAQAVPEKEDARRSLESTFFITRLGAWGIQCYRGALEFHEFVGQCALSFFRLLTGRTRLRWRNFLVTLQDVSASALPIVSLISFLIGLIIAFLGAVVLARFGASIYVSHLVGYGMLREMGAVMTGIIMAGRTGAAFAAEIGSMKVNEEIDALKTLGISPIDFIVLPKLIALFAMMPLLVLYADLIGILGGLLVSTTLLDISPPQYFDGLNEAVAMPDFYLGVIKGTVFGVIVAVAGCLRGMQCGNSADSVGLAATSAVVTGITLIIVANAVIDWVAAIYGI